MKQIPKYKEVSKKYSNMNVEVGEKTLLPTGLLVDHGGVKHSEGGTDVNLPEGAMIFSNAMKLDKNVVALLLNKDKSKVKRMTPAELAKKYATNELLENIESPDKYKANSAKLMLEKNIAQLNSIFQAQEEHKKVNGIESGKTLAEQGMKAEYGTAKYGGIAQGGNVVGGIDLNSLYKLINPYSPAFENVGTGYDDITDYNYDPTQKVLTRDALLYEAPNNLFDPEGKVLKDPQVTKELGMQTAFRGYPDSKQGMYSFDYGVISPAYRDDMQNLSSENISHLFQGLPDHNHPAQDTYNKHYSTILVDKNTNDKYFVVPGGTLSNASIPEGFIPISPEEAVQRKDSFKAYYSEPGKELETDWSNPSVAKPNAFAHPYNYDDLVKSVSRTTKWKVGDDGSYQEVTPNVPSTTSTNLNANSTTPEVPKKPMTDYAIKSHNQIAADLYRKLFSAEMQAPYEIFNPGIAPVVRPAYQSTAPVQQALNNLSYTLDNSNASTQYGNALYADGLAKSLESSNQISRYNQQAAMEAEQKNTGNLVNTFNQNQQGFAANANANNINFLKAKDRYEHYKDDLFSRVLENQVDRNTYEGMLQDRRLTERYSPSELLDNGAWNNFFDPQRYMQFDNKDTLNPDNGQKLASLSQDELTQLKTARDNETDPTLKAKLWELYLKAIESKSQSGGYLKKKGSYQVGGISDNDKNSNEITQNNSNLNWIQRGLFPKKYPYLTEGSDKKTHRLATAGFDDGTMVFPTIVQNKDRSLVEFDIDKALDYAMKTNTGVMVKDPQLADYYSKNGLIKHYQTGVNTTNYVKPIVPLQKYLTIDTIVPQQVNPVVSTPLVQRVKQILLPSVETPRGMIYDHHSKASDKIYEQQTGGVNSLFPSTTILNQQDIVRKELQDYFKSLGKTNATKRLNDMKNEYVSSNNNMNTKYQIPLIQEAYLMAYPVEMVPKSKSKRYQSGALVPAGNYGVSANNTQNGNSAIQSIYDKNLLAERLYNTIKPSVYTTPEDVNIQIKHFIKNQNRFDENERERLTKAFNTLAPKYFNILETTKNQDTKESIILKKELDQIQNKLSELSSDYSGKDDPYSEDAWRMYLGLPQENQTFKQSLFIPTKSKNKEANYYSLPNEFKQDLFEVYKNNKFNLSDFKNGLINEDVFNSAFGENKSRARVLGNFTVNTGSDENGNYISYYDKYDFLPKLPVVGKVDVSDIIGKPFEIYDRVYYNNYNGETKQQYYSDKELESFNFNKKDFDTLALQKELINRGYKFPKSTKADGTLDGILGEETKKALLDYQLKHKQKVYNSRNKVSVPGTIREYTPSSETGNMQVGGVNLNTLKGKLNL